MDGVAAPRGDPTSANSKFANAQGHGGWREEGRQGSHKDASLSPRCCFQWVEEHLARTIAKIEEKKDILYIVNKHLWYSIVVAKHACWHVISHIRRLEDLCGVFLFVHDLCSGQVEVQACGPPRGCAFAQFAVEAIAVGCFSILDSLSRLRF